MSSNHIRIEHEGRIIGVYEDYIRVEIVSKSACASCRAKAMCTASEEKSSRRPAILSNFMDTLPLAVSDRCKVVDADKIEHLKDSQTEVMLKAAKEGNVIFLGKASSYIFKNRKDALRIFVTASTESCAERISGVYQISDMGTCRELVSKTNARRKEFFETFAGVRWDAPENYDLCFNSDYLNQEEALEIIKKIVAGR